MHMDKKETLKGYMKDIEGVAKKVMWLLDSAKRNP